MMAAIRRALSDSLLHLAMRWTDRQLRHPLLAATQDPESAQLTALRRILAANAASEFGERHDFRSIRSWREYRDAVPVHDYEALRQAIDLQAATGRPVLTTSPVLTYARTSGTTGKPKDIPVTATTLALNRAAQRLTAATLHRGTGFFGGQILAFGAPAIEGRRPCGASYGSASGHAHQSLSTVMRDRLALPAQIFGIADPEQKYYLAALLGLAAPQVTGIAAANPSTLLRIVETVEHDRRCLLADLTCGRASRTGGWLLQ